jgi:alanyl-tRNA synthetase
MPATERLYYNDAFLRSFPAVVSDVREVSRMGEETLWQIALDRTAFYPTSGGQPHDTGLLRAVSRGGAVLEIPVQSVDEDDDGQIWHLVRKPISTGTPVEGEIEWDRRLDHMQQHSGQHLLSAIFLRELKAPTVSFHLGEAESNIDLASGPIAQHSLERIERMANEIIAEDRPVTVRYVSREEAESLLASGQLRKLPERAGDMRLVEIADLDRNACGGTHVRSTGQIGGLLLRSVEKVSRGVRLSFVCGLRAVRIARAEASVLARITTALSIGSAEIPAAIERLRSESKSAAKERQRLREELADYHAARLAVEVPIENGLRFVHRSFRDRDAGYVKLLASRLTSAVQGSVVLFSSEITDPCSFVVARSLDLSFDCGVLLKRALAELGYRGGGSPDFAQGEVAAAQADALRASLMEAIRKLDAANR